MKFICTPHVVRFIPDEARHSYACVTSYQRWQGYELNVVNIIPGATGETEKEARDKMLARVRSDMAQFLRHGAAVSDFELLFNLEEVDADGFVFTGDRPPCRRRVCL